MDSTSLLATLAFALALAAIAAALAARLRQSVILGYIGAGIAIGDHTPGFTADAGTVDVLAEVGVVLVLFSIGMQISVRDLLRVGPVATIGALAQVLAMVGVGMGLGQLLDWDTPEAFAVGAVLSNSSGTVIAKVLAERGEVRTLPGRIALGWSSVQDLSTIVLLVVLIALAGDRDDVATSVAIALAQASLFVIVLVPVGYVALPRIFAHIVGLGNREVFVLTATALVATSAYVATLFGISAALGAFVAGIILSESDVRHEILDGLLSLRDVFAGLFFISVGMLIDPAFVRDHLPEVLLLTAATVILKGALSGLLTLAFGHALRTALLTGVALAQSAEFSVLLAREGVERAVLRSDTFGLLLATAALSVVLSPALQALAHRGLRSWPRVAPEDPRELEAVTADLLHDHAVICGYGRVGRAVGAVLAAERLPFVAVDWERAAVTAARERGIPALLGNADTPTLLDAARLERARLLVVAIPDPVVAERLVRRARSRNSGLAIVARAHGENERDSLEASGADEAVLGEFELALEMTRFSLTRFGVVVAEVEEIIGGLRHRR